MKIIEKIINWLIVGLCFLLPIFFLPLTTEFYIFNKQSLLIFSTGLLLIFWTVKLLVGQKLVFKKTLLDLPLAIFGLTLITTTLIASPNKTEAWLNSNSTATLLSLIFLYWVITNNLKKKTIPWLFFGLIASASLLSLIAIYGYLGLGKAINGPDWFKNPLFTPTGGPLILITFLTSILILNLTLFIKKISQKLGITSLFLFLASFLTGLALIFTFTQVLPGKKTSLILPPFKSSWVIAIEAFKQSPLLGVGPGNYLTAFNRFRPIEFNNYSFWNTRFAYAADFPLEILTVGGAFAFGAWLFILFKTSKLLLANKKLFLKRKIISSFDHSKSKNEFQLLIMIEVAVLLLVQFFLPINFLFLWLFFLFLALLNLSQTQKVSLTLTSKAFLSLPLALVLILVLTSFYFWGRAWSAEFTFRRSLNALVQNQGLNTYNHQAKAISINPRYPLYRRAYSQTNLALANSLARQKNLSDQDRSNISILVQQAVNEAKAATSLNKTDVANWENLAQIYRNLISFAQGSDQWAIAAYRQAILTDPVNPLLRVNLGGLYYSLANFDEAIRLFQDAINLKPDYANAYYNLANAYKQQEKYPEALTALQAITSLIPSDSADFQKVLDEIETVRQKIPAPPAQTATSSAQPAERLTKPKPLPSTIIEPPIQLPQESGPEAVIKETESEKEISPTPSPQATPEASPTPEV